MVLHCCGVVEEGAKVCAWWILTLLSFSLSTITHTHTYPPPCWCANSGKNKSARYSIECSAKKETRSHPLNKLECANRTPFVSFNFSSSGGGGVCTQVYTRQDGKTSRTGCGRTVEEEKMRKGETERERERARKIN